MIILLKIAAALDLMAVEDSNSSSSELKSMPFLNAKMVSESHCQNI